MKKEWSRLYNAVKTVFLTWIDDWEKKRATNHMVIILFLCEYIGIKKSWNTKEIQKTIFFSTIVISIASFENLVYVKALLFEFGCMKIYEG